MRRRCAAVAAVALHAVVAAVLMQLHVRPGAEVLSDRRPTFAEVVLIELPARPFAPALASEPTASFGAEPFDNAQPGANVQARAKTESHAKTQPRAPARQARKEQASHAIAAQRESGRQPSVLGDTPSDGVSAATPSASTGALALSGLRDGAPSRGLPSMGTQASAPLYGAPGPAPATRAQHDAKVARAPRDFGFRRKRGRLVRLEPLDDAWSAELLPDGRVHFLDLKLCGVPGLRCWTKAKRRLLVATSAMRLAMAKNHARRNIERQLLRLNQDLLAIWRSHRPPRTRRRLIFEAWDECEEALTVDLGDFATTDPSEVDALRHGAGAAARVKILAFIERQIPAGSADAFVPAELVAMNGRRMSVERFEPYPAGR